MACGRQRSLQDLSERHTANSVDQLTFKYMMCKMDSSTDSDSEISPRWSDTCTLRCVSSAPESGASRRASAYKFAGRRASYSLFLDPYDGNSEDSDESNVNAIVSSRQRRQQGKGGCHLSGRRRQPALHHPAKSVKNGMRGSLVDQQTTIRDTSDVQMKCGGDSDLWDCELDTLSSYSDRDGCRNIAEEKLTYPSMHIQTMDVELEIDDLHTRSSTPGLQLSGEGSSAQVLKSCSERSSCNGSLFKRKVGLPEEETGELGPRKRQCVDGGRARAQMSKGLSHFRCL